MNESTREDLIATIEDLVSQFAYEGATRGGLPALTTGGLSALENAFEILGWTDPHPAPWRRCEYGKPRCKKWYGGIWPIDGTYMRLCSDHIDLSDARRAASSEAEAEVVE